MSEIVKGYILPLIMGLAGYFAAYLSLVGIERQTDEERIKTLYEELDKQRQRIEDQDRTIYALQAEVTRLTIQLAKHYDNGKALKSYLRPMPIPGWIKVTDMPAGEKFTPINPRIEMWYINPQYELMFNITNAKYHGKTDFEVGHWPDSVASNFRMNDLSALQRMGGECVIEQFPTAKSGGALVSGEVCKWVTEVNGFIAIAGHVRVLRE